MTKYEQLAEMLASCKKIVFFTGAGISCASGIPDFRSADGLYNQDSGQGYAPEQIISNTFFKRMTKEFYKFYRTKMVYPDAQPNSAHKFIASLQDTKEVSVVTQNIDGLHQKAGSKIVYELHGSILRNYCMDCHTFYSLESILSEQDIPVCSRCGGIVKPDVVLYEEPLDEDVIKKAIEAIYYADCVVIIGTSLMVYPAASYLQYYQGDNIAVINKEATSSDNGAKVVLHEDIVKVIEELQRVYHA